MRIVRIVSELDFGGVEKVLANTIPSLQNDDVINVQVIVLGKGGVISSELMRRGFNVQVLGANPRIPNLKLLFRLRTLLKIFKPHVVHTQGSEANFHGIWAARIAKVPVIIGEEIGIPNHHSYWKWIFKWVYQKADYIVAISEAVKKHIIGLGEVKNEKVRVIYNPVDLAFNKQVVNGEVVNESLAFNKKEEDTFVFVTTCRLVPIKNLERLILVFKELIFSNLGKNIRLDIIGDGPEKEKLEELVISKGLSEKIRLLGFQTNVIAFLHESNVFVLPSFTEGSSVSLAEAMVAGLPSIVTKNGGASEILGNSESGILVDPTQSGSIHKAMQKMLDHSQATREEMGLRAQKESLRFSIDSYIKKLLEIYKS
ncbi:glycosyltransferase [uncultured Cyclobacterium sp.]|uniref:glycosyltransferase n=1 Tax=uncultured Cyclobacterium sp. TaxID=453820 RepID=UPI0030EC8811